MRATFFKVLRARVSVGVGLVCLCAGIIRAAEAGRGLSQAAGADTSFRNEVQRAIDRGLESLRTRQDTNGFWSTADHPAVTALALTAFMGEPTGRFQKNSPAFVNNGYAFLLRCAKPDGSIYSKRELINYNTATSLMALLAANRAEVEPVLRKARAFLISQQIDLGDKGKLDTPFDGGVGYGDKYEHSDMSNTLLALEALYYSRHLKDDKALSDAKDLNWTAAIHFIQSCQNLPSHNRQAWVSGDPKDRGGFVYYPGQSMAGGETNQTTGRVALRSYGSISYAGLLSYIYANMNKDDPRVVAVFDWLRENYTLKENPGMGPQGLYYYLHTMAKALTLYGVDSLELKAGAKINWRKELAMRLINLQQNDGSWVNDNGRWWERDPNLVTAYAVISLEIILRGL
jgi:squalene-hopene/tetraprenyl-beta-curcumene cyclase